MNSYNVISTLNEQHKVYLVQSSKNGKVYVQKILDVYNIRVYEYLYRNPIPGIPQIINYYEQDSSLVVIEEYISGISLQDKIDNNELSISDIINYMTMLCNVLERLHSMNPPIIHRDIKPSNIIITSYNYAVLLDFNAAKQFSGNANSDTVLIGTPGYAAPEQYGFGSSSPQTDIYSLGIMLKEMLDNTASGNTINALYQIVEKCTQMTPAARYNSVVELKEAIRQADTVLKYNCNASLNYRLSSSYNTHYQRNNSRFLPPGFRTHTPWKMLLASVSYLFIFWLCLTLELENTYGAKLNLERFFVLIMFLSIIFCGFNYLNVQNILPLCKSKYRLLHYVGIVLLDVAIIFSLFIIMFIVESVCFPIR